LEDKAGHSKNITVPQSNLEETAINKFQLVICAVEQNFSEQRFYVLHCQLGAILAVGVFYGHSKQSRCLTSQIEVKTSEKSVDNSENGEELDTLYSRLVVETRSHDRAVLKSYEYFALEAAKYLQITINKTWIPRPHFLRRVVLKSIHIYKKHQVHYEFRTYFRVIEMKHLTGSTADTYMEYIQRNLPEGVSMKVTRTAIEKLPAHI
ncbi:28S ribosomal protein S10, mitochondrial, partial [Chamberlinius hualienensis]